MRPGWNSEIAVRHPFAGLVWLRMPRVDMGHICKSTRKPIPDGRKAEMDETVIRDRLKDHWQFEGVD